MQDGLSKLYEVNAANKKHEIWLGDSLSIEIFSENVAIQNLNYIHFNPVSGKWNLAKDYLDYYYSSARFYETGLEEFVFLNNLYIEMVKCTEHFFACHEPRHIIMQLMLFSITIRKVKKEKKKYI